MLPRIKRLTKRGSFTYVYKNGQKKHEGALSLIFVKSKSLKIGFSVNNKTGKAVVRNKLKRRLRAIIRQNIEQIKPAQAVISVRPEAVNYDFVQLKMIVINLLKNAGLIKSNNEKKP